MFKIGEFSRLTQVSIRMLRYYDEVGLLKPARIDSITNYRSYEAWQIPILNKIIFLRNLGFNIAEITEALEGWSDEFITQELERKCLEVEQEIQAEQERLKKIELAKKDIQKKKIEINYNVSIKAIPSFQVFSLRRRVPDYYSEGFLWKEMAKYAGDHNLSISEQTFTIYHDLDYREKDVDIEICAPVAKIGEDGDGFTYRRTEAIPIMACTMVYGSFENIAGAFLTFAEWLQEHNQYEMAGASRQIVHRGQWNEEDPEKYLTEIQVPLQKK
ncbi:DNA-binding transcriptional MerR regulator [Aequitasia blattaphilus]|uniref:MerR family transcriptional regulator n=1 Tax=Aequitasia blattaphilus TaxID=2949332 RepID=A0ABT1ECR3_9FIRM|nr:MerR family transcriptional regulator [Aequitasia blattaphilus]MCP1103625.1 MerR family transcriptional regulator [Aequitasia blattaphilus]MCR8616265.1 MerR family transcriptional regulator [Aequitasia blattaphilus]